MFDCAEDVLGHHNDEVTLPQEERDEMRQRRDTNRDRLKSGLKDASKPSPREFLSQGSYSMKTMTQDDGRDYDIDDGVYFDKDDLVGARGGDMSARDARQMVRDALDDGSFKTAPEVRRKCVRVYYNVGYHVDMPVYRRTVSTDFFGRETVLRELAASDWVRSDASDVTKWFESENKTKSPDEVNGRQLRRITRQLKKFAKSRISWKGAILSGFGITKLVSECFVANNDREDESLYYTMQAIRNRLYISLVVNHPVTPNETITSDYDDPKAKFLRDKLDDALEWLKPLFDSTCTQKQALKSWDKVFSTTYFSDRLSDQSDTSKSAAAPSVLSAGLLRNLSSTVEVQSAVRKEGGGRYA